MEDKTTVDWQYVLFAEVSYGEDWEVLVKTFHSLQDARQWVLRGDEQGYFLLRWYRVYKANQEELEEVWHYKNWIAG